MKTAPFVALSVVLPALLAYLASERSPQALEERPYLPDRSHEGGYLGSSACRSCHPSEFSSWQQTYHRTMTRPAADLDWNGSAAPSLPARLELDGRETRLFVDEAGKVWVQGPDLHQAGSRLAALRRLPEGQRRNEAMQQAYANADSVRQRLVMVTGSHHYLAFWVEGGPKRELRQLPFVFRLAERKWAPRREVFLQPPDAAPHIARWNANCIQCHSVAGRPRQSEGRDPITGEFWVNYETRVAELGISCEACHGPGERHVRSYRDPIARYAAHGTKQAAAHIIEPRTLSADKSSAICGQCHSYFSPRDAERWWEDGFFSSFRPGDALTPSRVVLEADLQRFAQGKVDSAVESMFWGDGSIRVGGREYNAHVESPCFASKEQAEGFSCTSCHSMHDSAPNDQLAFDDPEDDGMCTQCHDEITAGPEHTGHPGDSLGSRCVNCHMPKTTYALLKAIRSHRVGSPSARLDDPPSACSMCHVDQSRQWIHEKLEALFGIEGESSPPLVRGVPHAVERALAGNAAERALFADLLASKQALTTAGPAVAEAVLPHLERDPYAAVRRIAEKSKAELDAKKKQDDSARGSNKPSSATFSLEPDAVRLLLDQQDDRPITISE